VWLLTALGLIGPVALGSVHSKLTFNSASTMKEESTMSTFTHRGFNVHIHKYRGGFGFNAFSGKHRIVEPRPGYSVTPYPSEEEAEAAAKQSIFMYEVTTTLSKLSAIEQAFIAHTIKRIYEGELVVEPDSHIVEELMKAGEIRRK
jgi:hypothetical protein